MADRDIVASNLVIAWSQFNKSEKVKKDDLLLMLDYFQKRLGEVGGSEPVPVTDNPSLR